MKDTNNGYPFRHCQGSRSLQHCFDKWEKILSDTNGHAFSEDDSRGLLKEIRRNVRDRFVIGGMSEEEAAGAMVGMTDKLGLMFPAKDKEKRSAHVEECSEEGQRLQALARQQWEERDRQRKERRQAREAASATALTNTNPNP